MNAVKKHTSSRLRRALQLGVLTSTLSLLATFTPAHGQSGTSTSTYYNHILPQLNAREAEIAAINARQSSHSSRRAPEAPPSFSGDISGGTNYGVLAYYSKSPGVLGYVFESGYVRPGDAQEIVELVCSELHKKCGDFVDVNNQWLIVASVGTAPGSFIHVTSPSPEEATATLNAHCTENNLLCAVVDTFDVTRSEGQLSHTKGIQAVR